MGRPSGGRLVAQALKRQGVEQIFTLSGGHIMDICYGCREVGPITGIEIIDMRSEASAGYAAGAYAGVTGRPGVSEPGGALSSPGFALKGRSG